MGRVVVVAVEYVAEGIHPHVVGVAQVVANGGQAGAVRVHPHDHAAHPKASIRALLADCFAVPVVATGEKVPTVLRLNVGSAVAEAEVPLARWTAHRGVQGMVVPRILESGQKHLALVYLGIEFRVAVNVGVHDQVGRGGEHDLVVEHGQAERSVAGLRFGYENMRLVRLAVAVRVAHHHDGLPVRYAPALVVVNPLGQPDAALRIDVHCHRRKEQGRLGPDFHLEVLAQFRVQLKRGQRHLVQVPLYFAERFPVGQLAVGRGKRQRTGGE